jgi:NAD(P)-dependent dehydrogenase (short-subunit alcohol dehydrogenase family)
MALPHLQFFNNATTWPFIGLLFFFLFWTTGLFWVILSAILALGGATLLRRVTNHTIPVPEAAAIFITGCSTGLGYDAALHFANIGFTVFASVRKVSDQQNLEKAFGALPKPRGALKPVIMDLADQGSIAAAHRYIETEIRKTGTVFYALINNAGYNEAGMLELMSPDRVRLQFETNVIGPLSVMQYFLPLLRECKKSKPSLIPRIIWTSSAVGQFTFPGSSLYSATKHAIEALAAASVMELKHWGIKSILIQPGAIKTAFHETARTNRALPAGDDRVEPDVKEYYTKCVQKTNSSPMNLSEPVVATDAFSAALLDSSPLESYRAGNDVQMMMPINKALLVPNIAGQLVGSRLLA